jgi:NADH-quinone oxidoreductase subunit N
MLMLPELVVIATAFIVLLLDSFLDDNERATLGLLTLIGLGIATATVVVLLPQQGSLLGGRFVFDSVAGWFKLVFLLAGIATVTFSWDQLTGRVHASQILKHTGEYYTILLFTISGMMYLISSREIITLYISLELTTIPLFVLVAWKRDDSLSGEAALKYVILGAMSSAILLFGMGLLYGLSGQTSFEGISKMLTGVPALYLAMALIIAGIGFKLTLVPFHLWAADVYQGAPIPITAYLSIASKGAGLAFMFLLFYQVFGKFLAEWNTTLALFATITMTLGNVVAIVQQNIKRFMAFSAISQAGYLIMGFLGPFPEGVPVMIFYLLVYLVSNLVVFAVIIFYANETGREQVNEYQGLAQTNPLIALAMMIALFSLAGIPPLSGFVGKFFLFSIASQAGLHWLVAVAAINSTISLYYYLRIVRQMYIEPPLADARKLSINPLLASTVIVTAVATIALGILPTFYEVIHSQTIDWMK